MPFCIDRMFSIDQHCVVWEDAAFAQFFRQEDDERTNKEKRRKARLRVQGANATV